MGGGVTGCSCALTLAQAGVRVRLHEARAIASGASGRNGGFALRGGLAYYDAARSELGPELARQFWELTERTLERMATLAGDAFVPTGSVRLADETELALLRAEYDALVADGFAAVWHDDLPGRLGGLFAGALEHPGDGSLRPARWVRRLARHAAEAGAELREHDRVESLDALGDVPVVVATDGYTGGLVPFLDDVDPADARPGARHGAARRGGVRAPALRALRLRLLAAVAGRPARARRPARHEPRDGVHRRRGDHAADPGTRSSACSRACSGTRAADHAPLGRDLRQLPRRAAARGPRARHRRTSGSPPATRATATCSAWRAATSSPGRSSARSRPSWRCSTRRGSPSRTAGRSSPP